MVSTSIVIESLGLCLYWNEMKMPLVVSVISGDCGARGWCSLCERQLGASISSCSYIHGSLHRESNWIIVQQDASVFSLLHICRHLYMFRVLTLVNPVCYHPLSLLSSNSTTTADGSNARSCNYSCTSSWWWVSTPETCRAVYRCVINWMQSHLVGKSFNLIHVFLCST